MAAQQAVQTASVVTVLQPNTRLLTAAAGHLAHQAVSVGVPTFVREMLAAGLTAGLQASPQAAIALQAGMMVMNVGLQVVRERRESREPNEAARAFHALSPEQWAEASPQEQDAMRQTQAKHSRLFTVLQVAASTLNLGLGVNDVKSGQAAAAISRVATDVKTAAYATMRDTLQASFRMVGIQGETHGLAGAHLASAIATYAAAGLASGYVSQALTGSAAPEAALAANVRNGVVSPAEAGMSMAAAWGTAATVAGVSAAVNTVTEAIDWFSRTQLEAERGGVTQQLAPRINNAPENRDYGRLLDTMPGRMAFINVINSAVGAAGRLASNAPASVQSLIGNVGGVAVTASLDYSVSNTFQAAAAVRVATSRPPEPSLTQEPEASLRPTGRTSAPPPPPPSRTSAPPPPPPRNSNV